MGIDIIIPVYNTAPWLEGLFRAFAVQAAGEFRLILVDDGSTDGSGPLLDRLASVAPFPTLVLHRQNGGVSRARNAGLRQATAEWVTFFDADDLPAPDYLPWLQARCREETGELLLFGSRRVTEDFRPTPQREASPPRSLSSREALEAFLRDPTRLGVYNLLLRRSFLQRTGLCFAEGWPYYEDYDFLVRALVRADTLSHSDKLLYYYVMHGGTAVARFTPERLRCLNLLDRLGDWLVSDAPELAPLYRRFFPARIYWSLLWQGALAAPDYQSFRRFARDTRAGLLLRCLRGFPEARVRLSSLLFRLSPPLYFRAVRRLGRRRSRVEPVTAPALRAAARAMPDLRRVLVYGMSNNPGGVESYLLGLYGRHPEWRWDFLCDFPAMVGQEALEGRGSLVHFIPNKRSSLWGHIHGVEKLLRENPLYTALYLNALDAGCFFPAAAAWLRGRRVVVHSHNGDTDKPRLHRFFKPLLNALPLGAAACSPGAARHMFPERRAAEALIVPNAIDAAAFRYDPALGERTRAALGLSGRRVLLHVGRLSYQKNPLFLLDLIAALHELDPDWVLVSVGEGEMGERFRAAVRERRLEPLVRMLGVRQDVPRLMQAASVFVLPSFYEGLPIVALEAQAAGLPCLFSDAVPREAGITDLARFLPLSRGAGAWAQALRSLAARERRDTYEELRAAGYDMSCCEKTDRALEKLLLG